MRIANKVDIDYAVLRVELTADVPVVMPKDVASQLGDLGWLSAMARCVGEDEGEPSASVLEQAVSVEAPLLQMRYGSPCVMCLAISEELLWSAPAVALLAFGIKQLWTLDLELKTRRITAWLRYEEALRDAEHARSLHKDKEALDEADSSRGWPPGISRAISARAVKAFRWRGEQASLEQDP